MKSNETVAAPAADEPPSTTAQRTVFTLLIALSVSHMINDTLQSLLPAVYPVLKDTFGLSFAQIGLITFVAQLTASLLQPLVGTCTDRRPQPYSLAIGMGSTLVGLVMLSRAGSFHMILVSAALVGVGSAIFHPEASRLARLASGGRHGLAQSLFQLGGNFGSSLGPLAAAWVVAPRGQHEIMWFALLAAAGIVILHRVGGWYARHLVRQRAAKPVPRPAGAHAALSRGRVIGAMTVLAALIFSKYFYLACFTSYYTFYLIGRFHVTVAHSQVLLFVFLFAVAAGTIIGGPVGDRVGRRKVIWASILGVAPFTLALPYVGLGATVALSVVIGVILSSAFSAIVVYAQELVPGKVGMVSGIFFGLAFGMAGIGSALLGKLADHTSIHYVFEVCGYLPLLGLLAALLPDLDKHEP